MEDVRVVLSASCIALMLTYLWGDVLRIYSGDCKAGEFGGRKISRNQWMGVAVFMIVPVIMILASLALSYGVDRWANVTVAVVFFGLKMIGLPSYHSSYDKFLIIIGLGFNALTVWYAWQWIV